MENTNFAPPPKKASKNAFFWRRGGRVWLVFDSIPVMWFNMWEILFNFQSKKLSNSTALEESLIRHRNIKTLYQLLWIFWFLQLSLCISVQLSHCPQILIQNFYSNNHFLVLHSIILFHGHHSSNCSPFIWKNDFDRRHINL